MENGRQLRVNLYSRAVGDAVSLDLIRARHASDVSVPVEEREDDPGRLAQMASALTPDCPARPAGRWRRSTSTIASPSCCPDLREKTGAVVVAIAPDAPYSQQGKLKPGDVIRGINGKHHRHGGVSAGADEGAEEPEALSRCKSSARATTCTTRSGRSDTRSCGRRLASARTRDPMRRIRYPPRVCISRCASRFRAATGISGWRLVHAEPLFGAAIGAHRPDRCDQPREIVAASRPRAAGGAGRGRPARRGTAATSRRRSGGCGRSRRRTARSSTR